jgi:hypothetical protein
MFCLFYSACQERFLFPFKFCASMTKIRFCKFCERKTLQSNFRPRSKMTNLDYVFCLSQIYSDKVDIKKEKKMIEIWNLRVNFYVRLLLRGSSNHEWFWLAVIKDLNQSFQTFDNFYFHRWTNFNLSVVIL